MSAQEGVGFVGLGNLGQAMALALLRAGWPVTVLDRDPAKAEPCAAEGATVAGSGDELVGCRLLALAVPDDAAVESVLQGPSGLLDRLSSGSAVVVHSTILPRTAQRLAAAAGDRGVALVDAPVSGGSDRALAGDLTVMVGGSDEAVARLQDYLAAVGSDVRHVGPAGAGEATKLANQLMMFGALAAAHEALALAAAYDVSEEAVLGAVRSSTGDTWVTRNWGFFDKVAQAYDRGGTPVRERPWSKDLWEVCEAARAADVRVPLAAMLAQTLAETVEDHATRSRKEG